MPSPASDKTEREQRESMKKHWKIIEFAYGFCVTYKGKRVALCGTEDRAEEIVRAGKSERE
jgi:hypothetical protein